MVDWTPILHVTLSACASMLGEIIFVNSNRSTANAPFNPPARVRGPFKPLSEGAATGSSNHSICSGLRAGPGETPRCGSRSREGEEQIGILSEGLSSAAAREQPSRFQRATCIEGIQRTGLSYCCLLPRASCLLYRITRSARAGTLGGIT